MRRAKRTFLGLLFWVLSAALLSLGFEARASGLGLLYLNAAVAFLGLGGAYLMGWAGLLGKTRRGGLLASSYLFFWPYFLLSYITLLLFRLLVREAPLHQVAPGLFLGGQLLPWDEKRYKSLGFCSVLDLTAEFSEVGFLRRLPAYYCVPLLDGSGPTAAELQLGIEFIGQRLKAGPVYVHCAQGHGRSATFVLAYLVASGQAPTVQAALQQVRACRPGVKLATQQMQALLQFKP